MVAPLPNSGIPIFIELFAGRGSLSKSMIQAGFEVISVDHEVIQPLAPIVSLDLSSKDGQLLCWQIVTNPRVFAIHLGLPCGTSSRARDKPVPQSLRQQGAPSPMPLRSAEHPLGLPSLAGTNLQRVKAANILYEFALAIILYAVQNKLVISVENPANSWLWSVFAFLTRQKKELAEAYNALKMVLFHACCHGSTRRKHTGWLSTPTVYASLAAECQNDHEHEPWGIRWQSGSWRFDTASEAAYPMLLAQRASACLVEEARKRNLQLQKPPKLHHQSMAVVGQQSKKHRPLIPEYHHFVLQPANLPAPKGAKIIAPHLGGEVLEEECGPSDASRDNTGDTGDTFSDNIAMDNNGAAMVSEGGPKHLQNKVGYYHSPKQFVSMARQTMHPMDTVEHLEGVTKRAIEYNLTTSPDLIKLNRKKNLLQARIWARMLEEEEKALHAAFPECLEKVLKEKRLLLWQKLLQIYQYDDLKVFDLMARGVELVGQHDTPPCFPELLKPASLTEDQLRSSAVWRRKAALGRRMVVDPLHIDHLTEATNAELEMGFLEGPFTSEAEVTAHLGCSNWSVVRRFVLVQGAEMKLRPIDDCLEAQINHAFTSTSYLKLQDVDYITGMALRVATAVSGGLQKFGSGQWLGKCLDLSKAYKQMAISPAHRDLAVIFFHTKEGQPLFYVANALMFGSTAAVYAFNRVSRSLWHLFNTMLMVPCGVFYDDFPLFSPSELASDADSCVSELLDLLGWKHARTGPKGLPFEPVFQVLGCTLNLERVSAGVVTLENKPGRVDRILEKLSMVETEGRISLHDAQVLHGLMRYACGFFAGRLLQQVCGEVLSLGSPVLRSSISAVKDFCAYAKSVIAHCRPREISVGDERRPILIFTDGAWEDGRAGIGAVIIDLSTNFSVVLEGSVPDPLLQMWLREVGDQLICQIELYTMVVIRWVYASLLQGRRTIWWVDNHAARYSLIKGSSSSLTMKDLCREFYRHEAVAPTFSWIERVPSPSNIADAPSRGSPMEACSLLGLSSWETITHPQLLVDRLLEQRLVDRKGKMRTS